MIFPIIFYFCDKKSIFCSAIIFIVLWCEPRAGHDVWMTDGQKINQSPKVPLVGMSCGVPEYIPSFCLENNYCSLCHYHEILKRHWFPDSLQVYKHNSSVDVECQFTKRVQSFALITPVGDWHKQKTVFLCLHKTKTLNWTKMLHTNTNFLSETLALASLTTIEMLGFQYFVNNG